MSQEDMTDCIRGTNKSWVSFIITCQQSEIRMRGDQRSSYWMHDLLGLLRHEQSAAVNEKRL